MAELILACVLLAGCNNFSWVGFLDDPLSSGSSTSGGSSTYTVTYNANGGSGSVPTDSNNYLQGATVTVLGSGSLVRSGDTFAGWNTQANGSGTTYTQGQTFSMGTSNVTLYAVWVLSTYTVTYNANGGSGSVPTDSNN